MRLPKNQITEYSKKYDLQARGTPDELIENELKQWFASHKFLDRIRFIKLGTWKSPRARNQYAHRLNTDERIKELTTFALSSKDEYTRVMVPQLLRGVSWGVASVILHLAYPEEYMILDFRAVWSLGLAQPKKYDFDYWLRYTTLVRKLARKFNVSLRTFDKALWEYSKEKQLQ